MCLLATRASAQTLLLCHAALPAFLAVDDAPPPLHGTELKAEAPASSPWSDWHRGLRARATVPSQITIGQKFSVAIKIQADPRGLLVGESEIPKNLHRYLKAQVWQNQRRLEPDLVCGYQDWMNSGSDVETTPVCSAQSVRSVTYSDAVFSTLIDDVATPGPAAIRVIVDWGCERAQQHAQEASGGPQSALGKTWRGVLETPEISVQLNPQPKSPQAFLAPTRAAYINGELKYDFDMCKSVTVDVPLGRQVFHTCSVDSRLTLVRSGFPTPFQKLDSRPRPAGAGEVSFSVFSIQVFNGSKSVFGPARPEDVLWSATLPIE